MSNFQTKSQFIAEFNASCPARAVLATCPAKTVLAGCPVKAMGTKAEFIKTFQDGCPAKAMGTKESFVKEFKDNCPIKASVIDSKTWLSNQKMFVGNAPTSEQNVQANLDRARFICDFQNQSKAGRSAILENIKQAQKLNKEMDRQSRKFYSQQTPQMKKHLLKMVREEKKQDKQDAKIRRKALNTSKHKLNGKYQYVIDC